MFGQDSPTPWFFESSSHIEAINRLLYVIEQREPVGLLTGVQGAGKTHVLQRLTTEVQTLGLSAIFLNLSGVDDDSALFQLAERVSEQARVTMSRHEVLACLRAEFSGRAQCGIRTPILLDDVHLADFAKESFLRFLVSMAASTRGFTIIACGQDSMPEILMQHATVPVALAELDTAEASDYLRQLLPRLGCPYAVCEEAGIRAAVDLCRGRLQTLSRLGEVMSVFHQAWPSALITTSTVRQLAKEIGLPPHEELLNRRVLKLA